MSSFPTYSFLIPAMHSGKIDMSPSFCYQAKNNDSVMILNFVLYIFVAASFKEKKESARRACLATVNARKSAPCDRALRVRGG